MGKDDRVVKQIEMIAVADLKPADRNPRLNTQAIDAVARSIEQFGFNQPLAISDDLKIVAGHTRWEAAKKLGIKEVPCVRVSHLTKAQMRAYLVADNKTAEIAGWDEPLLREELMDLRVEGIDLLDTGFSEGEIQLLFDGFDYDYAPGDSGKKKEGGPGKDKITIKCPPAMREKLLTDLRQWLKDAGYADNVAVS